MPKVVTVYDRALEFESDGFYVFDKLNKILMCKFCNVKIEWARKDTCIKHCRDSLVHKQKKAAAVSEPSTSKRQISVTDSFQVAKKSKVDKDVFVTSLTKAFMEANIPLEKLGNPALKNFVETFVPGKAHFFKINLYLFIYIVFQWCRLDIV